MIIPIRTEHIITGILMLNCPRRPNNTPEFFTRVNEKYLKMWNELWDERKFKIRNFVNWSKNKDIKVKR